MVDANEIADALRVPCTVSSRMQTAFQMWEDVYRNDAPWLKKRVRSLRIPSSVCKELKRLTMTEFSASLNDAQLNAVFQKSIPMFRRKLDFGLAMGGMLFKPYWTANGIQLDFVPQNQYLPIHYTADFCDAVACPETVTIEKTSYTRIEIHNYDRTSQTHTIENRCFRSDSPAFLGKECSLSEVPVWSGMLAYKKFYNVTNPLLSVFQIPDSNSIDPDSPLGISAFSDAVDFIRDADEQWERILWELESSERAIDASEDLFRFKGGKPELPKGRERMFRTFSNNPNTGTGIFETFSPEIRDTSYFHAFNQMLRRIESSCGLSYGTLSEVSDVEKTAEEVKSSKQRSFSRVSDIQESLRTALENMVSGMQYLRDYYENRRNGDVTLKCTFGDGILEDADKEFNRRLQMVTAGLYSKEQFVMWYFSCDETTAVKLMPKMEGIFDANTLTV